MKRKRLFGQRLPLLVAHCSAAFFAANANAQSGDATQWSITPYIWASDTTVDLTTDFSYNGPMAGFNFRF